MSNANRLEKLMNMIHRIDQTSQANSHKLDRLYNVVIGNGDDHSIIIRLRDVEAQLRAAEKERHKMAQQIDHLSECVDRLEETAAAWKNRAGAIAFVLSALGGAVAIFGSRILEALVGP